MAASRAAPKPAADLGEDALVDGPLGDVPLGLAAQALQLELDVDELLDLVVGEAQRLDDDGLGDLLGAGLDHDDGVLVPVTTRSKLGLVLESRRAWG